MLKIQLCRKCPQPRNTARRPDRRKRSSPPKNEAHTSSIPESVAVSLIEVLRAKTKEVSITELLQEVRRKVSYVSRRTLNKAIRKLHDCAFVVWVRHTRLKIKPNYLNMGFEEWREVFFGPVSSQTA